MRLNNAMGLEGKFKIEVKNAVTGEERVLDWQDNKILNQILSSSVNKANSFLYLRFGTGTTTPTVNDTALAAPITEYISTPLSGPSGLIHKVEGTRVGEVHTKKFTYKFVGTQGAIQGNITELGLAATVPAMTGLFTRALIKDESNNPTVLTLGANDILTVYYETSNITDCSIDIIQTKTFTFNGQTITAKLRLINQDAVNTLSSDLISYSLLSAGSPVNNVNLLFAGFILPRFLYMTIANGTISNLRNVTIGSLTSVLNRNIYPDQSNINGAGIGYNIGTSTSYREFAAGVATGTWKYLFFNGYPTNPVTSQTEMNRCNLMIEFDPPLVKAAADKFIFDTLQFIGGGIPQ